MISALQNNRASLILKTICRWAAAASAEARIFRLVIPRDWGMVVGEIHSAEEALMVRFKNLVIGGLIVIAPLVALNAQPGVPGNPDPAAVQGGTFTADPMHTRVQFSVSHMGLSDWYGDFSGVNGTLSLDPKHADADRLDVLIPAASVSSINATLDGELKGADWFNAAQFPTIHFVATRVTPTGAGTATIAGDLTFHGVTRPVVLATKFIGGGMNPITKAYTVGFNATTSFHRSDFGVAKYVPMIGDEVQLRISASFERKL